MIYPALMYDITNDIFIAVKSGALHKLIYSTPQFRVATQAEKDMFYTEN